MLEITVRRYGGPGTTTKTFQFENDELQAFLTEGAVADGAEGAVFNIGGLRALGGVPAYAHGFGSKETMPTDRETAESRTHNADGTPKTTGAGDYRTPRDTLGIRTPIQETARAKAADADAKAKSEKK
jgi:hypothetical protein